MQFKTLISREDPSVYGVIENQEVHYSMMPELLPLTVTTEDLTKYISPEMIGTLKSYELKDVELTIK